MKLMFYKVLLSVQILGLSYSLSVYSPILKKNIKFPLQNYSFSEFCNFSRILEIHFIFIENKMKSRISMEFSTLLTTSV